MNEHSKKLVAVVSGAMGYVGMAVVKHLAADGFAVALLYHTAGKEEVDGFISSLSGDGHAAYKCNLENEVEIGEVMGQIEKDMGSIYVCVHAAGKKPERKALLDTSGDQLLDQYKANFFTGFNFITACARLMKEHTAGVIIGITTIGVVIPEFGRSLGGYMLAKLALQDFLNITKEDLQLYGIRVHSVAPGFMSGGMNADIPEAFKQIAALKNPSKRLTTADDVAEKIAYLCSEKAKMETALTYTVAEEYQPNNI